MRLVDVFDKIGDRLIEIIRQRTERFADSLQEFLSEILTDPIPDDWQQRLQAFVVETEVEGGLEIQAESVAALEQLILWYQRFYAQRAARARMNGAARAGQAVPGYRVSVTPNHLPLADAAVAQLAAVAPARQQAAPPQPSAVFKDGLEVAGPGPETTYAYQEKVRRALDFLDPEVGAWWKANSVAGLVRARPRSFLSGGYTTRIDADRPVITVDDDYTTGQTAQAIVNEARSLLGWTASWFFNNFSAHSQKYHFAKRPTPEAFRAWQKRSVKEAAGVASFLAELYVTSLATLTASGDLIVSLGDLAENGPRWQQLLSLLPLLPLLPIGAIFVEIGKYRLKLSKPLNKQLQNLDAKHAERLLAEIRAARTEVEAKQILEHGLANPNAIGHFSSTTAEAILRRKPPFPPPVAEIRAPIGPGKTAPDPRHVFGRDGQDALAHQIHELYYQAVIRWGKPVTANGPDVISYDFINKRIILWDNKARSNPVRIQKSKTFENPTTMERSFNEAWDAIEQSQLFPEDKTAAFASLKNKTFISWTAGSGSAKNSVLHD